MSESIPEGINFYFGGADRPSGRQRSEPLNLSDDRDVLDRFSDDFWRKAQMSPYARNAYNVMSHGGSPYVLIESLCDVIQSQQQDMTKLISELPPKPIVMQDKRFLPKPYVYIYGNSEVVLYNSLDGLSNWRMRLLKLIINWLTKK